MREIKFRAWKKSEKRMLDWNDLSGLDPMGLWHALDGTYLESVMQYTGLKDKNGKEIYEGDLLDNSVGLIAQVKFGEHCLDMGSPIGWYAEWDNGIQGFLNRSWQEAGEIIGNIYENPELLKG